jgi:hypothetical protein
MNKVFLKNLIFWNTKNLNGYFPQKNKLAFKFILASFI